LPLNSRRVKREPLAGDAPMVLAACALDELRRFRPLDAPERILHQKALAQAEQVYRDARTLALYLAWLNAHVTGAAYREGAGA
ncbi:MAG TPA: hypothetical protein VGS80_22385, partial [Ktedonobacterales bacterium]|nr:hypothetical protein [Ktedonobacterales bacterium]